jgi:hypothetical protein
VSDLRVLYISGAPRSGTTVLGMALGQLAGACDVGELWALWRPAFRHGDLCGCGVAVRDCPFWLAVARRAVGPDFETAGPELGRLHRRVLGTGRVPRAWLHVAGIRRDPAYDRYAEALGDHYRAIAEESGARLVVDSSKMAGDALIATTIPGIELDVLHLVRDPRGIAWSWRKEVRQPGPEGRTLDRRGPLAVAARWNAYNLFAEALLRPRVGRDHYRALRYEDFARDPVAELTRVVEWLGWPADALPVAGDPPGLTVARPSHPVWGNPVRTNTGTVPIRVDEAWRERLGTADRLAVTLATLPLLLRYHYPIGRGTPGPTTPGT